MKVRKYKQRVDGEWFRLGRYHKLTCCDCGLTHLFRWRVRKGEVELMAVRDNRATGQLRRHKKFERK